MNKTYHIQTLEGEKIATVIDQVAQLRLAVFREYPYLYDGDLEYERKYLKTLSDSPRAAVVVVKDGEQVVGASTCLPLEDADEPFREPFEHPSDYYYFGESVLLPEYRGQGLGHVFFDRREEVAEKHGFRKTCFCGVVRDENHPLCDPAYRDLGPFWEKRGYHPIPGCTTTYGWKDLGEAEETEKVMQFWEREL